MCSTRYRYCADYLCSLIWNMETAKEGRPELVFYDNSPLHLGTGFDLSWPWLQVASSCWHHGNNRPLQPTADHHGRRHHRLARRRWWLGRRHQPWQQQQQQGGRRQWECQCGFESRVLLTGHQYASVAHGSGWRLSGRWPTREQKFKLAVRWVTGTGYRVLVTNVWTYIQMILHLFNSKAKQWRYSNDTISVRFFSLEI